MAGEPDLALAVGQTQIEGACLPNVYILALWNARSTPLILIQPQSEQRKTTEIRRTWRFAVERREEGRQELEADAGAWKLETGGWRLGTGGWGLEAERTDHQGLSCLTLPVFFFMTSTFQMPTEM